LSLALPDGSAWKIDDHATHWLRARHEPTRSRLSLRKWNEGELVTRKACYERARDWDPALPDLDTLRLIDDRTRHSFEALSARVAVGVRPGEGVGSADAGYVVAIVGDVRRCIVVVYETEATGADAEGTIAGRLAVVTDRLLPSIKFDPNFAPAREPPHTGRRGVP
jgi:hypothetical protein